jgi:hypothetical protein
MIESTCSNAAFAFARLCPHRLPLFLGQKDEHQQRHARCTETSKLVGDCTTPPGQCVGIYIVY